MKISEFLNPNAVCCISAEEASDKDTLLAKLSELAHNIYGIEYELAYRSLQERELASSTGLGQGIALPHARSEEFDGIVGVFAKLERPMEFDSPDRLPVDLVFCMFAPTGESVDYLKSLSNVARTLRTEALRERLRSTADKDALHLILTESSVEQC